MYLLRDNAPIYNLQVFLRTISKYNPNIRSVIPSGEFNETTRGSVSDFQNEMSLLPNGVVDFYTWNEVVKEYNKYVMIENHMSIPFYPDEGVREDNDSFYPTILLMQSMINSLSDIFSNINKVSLNGVIDDVTLDAIGQIQKIAGMDVTYNISPEFIFNLHTIYETYISSDKVGNYMSNIT